MVVVERSTDQAERDEDDTDLLLSAPDGQLMLRAPMTRGLTGAVASSGKPLRLEDVASATGCGAELELSAFFILQLF